MLFMEPQQFHLVDFDDHMHIHGSEYSSDETLCMLVSLWSLRPSLGRAGVFTSFQCSKGMHNVAQALTEWDTAVRVLHIAKPPTRSSNQGLSRFSPHPCTISPPSLLSPILRPLSEFNIFPQTGFQIGKQLQGWNRPASDFSIDLLVMPYSRLEKRIVTMLKDITDDRTHWMADVLIGSSDTNYNNRFG